MASSSVSVSKRLPYTTIIRNAWADLYNATSNPNGNIILAVAENAVSKPAIAEALSAVPPLPISELGYTYPFGSPEALTAIASYLEQHHTHHRVVPADLVLASSVGSLIDALVCTIAEPGDAVLTFSPGYYGHEKHVCNRSGLRLVLADLDEYHHQHHHHNHHDYRRSSSPSSTTTINGDTSRSTSSSNEPVTSPQIPVSVAALDRAWLADGGDHSCIRVVLVSSPHNPTGEVLSAAAIAEIVAWARERQLHVIFDEVYANSVHDPAAVFRSAADVLHNDLENDVHIIWSVSKDFAMAGVRLAALLSHNQYVVNEIRMRYAMFCASSRLAQWYVTHLLSNREWTARFIEDNAVRLRLAYERCVKNLRALRVPFLPSAAGFFVVADLRAWMTEESDEAELVLWEKMSESKVLLSRSTECLGMRCGLFRVCFAAVNMAAQDIAWQRLREVLQ